MDRINPKRQVWYGKESRIIEKNTVDVTKEDILCGLDYEDETMSHVQQMLYHAFQKIEKLEAQIKKAKG